MFSKLSSPSFMMEPFPKFFSILSIAACRALSLSDAAVFSISSFFAIFFVGIVLFFVRYWSSRSLSNCSCQGRPCLLGRSMMGQGRNVLRSILRVCAADLNEHHCVNHGRYACRVAYALYACLLIGCLLLFKRCTSRKLPANISLSVGINKQ